MEFLAQAHTSVERFSENFGHKAEICLIFSLECTDFNNVIFEKIAWAPSEVAEVEWQSMFKFHRNQKQQKF